MMTSSAMSQRRRDDRQEGGDHDGSTRADGSAPEWRKGRMELTAHLEAIRGDLESLIASDEALASAFERMARPIEATLQLRLLDVLGDGALELTEQLPTGHAELRVSGRDASIVYVGQPEAAPEPPPAPDD